MMGGGERGGTYKLVEVGDDVEIADVAGEMLARKRGKGRGGAYITAKFLTLSWLVGRLVQDGGECGDRGD